MTKSESPAIEPELLTDDDVSAITQVKTGTLAAWRSRRQGPPFFRMGRCVRYRRADIEAWLATKRVV